MHAYMTVYACTAKGIFVFLEAMLLPSIGTFKKKVVSFAVKY